MVRQFHWWLIVHLRWISELFDGIRFFGDGKKFTLRNGKEIVPPKPLPSIPVEGVITDRRRNYEELYNDVIESNWIQKKLVIVDAPLQIDMTYQNLYSSSFCYANLWGNKLQQVVYLR